MLGKGHHADIALKLAVVQIHRQIVRGELVIKSKQKLPRGMVATNSGAVNHRRVPVYMRARAIECVLYIRTVYQDPA